MTIQPITLSKINSQFLIRKEGGQKAVGMTCLKFWGKKSFQLKILHPAKLPFKSERQGFPGGAVVENPPINAGDTGSSPGPGRPHMLRSN